MDKSIQHKTLEVRAKVKELKQRDLEAFGSYWMQERPTSASERRGANVRAAIQAGWFEELEPAMTVEDTYNQDPRIIRLLGDAIDQIYEEVTAVPPE